MSTLPRSILVICEGNHCRSPIGEALLRRELGDKVAVASAGLAALVGEPAHREAQRWGAAHDLDLSEHRGRAFSPEAARASDLILVMDAGQKRACETLIPSARGRVFLMGQWLPDQEREVPDPIGGAPSDHDRAYDRIARCIKPWLARLLPGTALPRTS